MAANKVRGDHNNPSDVEGKAEWFDMGTYDMMNTCASCHIGGGPFEGQVQIDGAVIPWDDPSLSPQSTTDRDFYSYGPDTTVQNFYGPASIAEAIAPGGNPELPDAVNWRASGVMEADCLICHIDPDHTGRLQAADGLRADANRPRLMIFAERDGGGNATAISFGTPFGVGLQNETARPYTDGLNRMSRPTPMAALGQLPAAAVGDMMTMWVYGLMDIENGTNTQGLNDDGTGNPFPNAMGLPFALYGQNISKLWTMVDHDGDGGAVTPMVPAPKTEYCPNPYGNVDEANRLGYHQNAIGALFGGMLNYLLTNGYMTTTGDMMQDMGNMMNMFFNDFVVAYQCKDQMDRILPQPFAMRDYEAGKFYTDVDDFQASVRDYVRQPLLEGEGGVYTGRVGLAYDAMSFATALSTCSGTPYNGGVQGVDVAAVMDDWQNNAPLATIGNTGGEVMADGATPCDAFDPAGMTVPQAFGAMGMAGGAKHETLPSFFGDMATAELMGLDLNGNGSPLTYIKMLKDTNATATGSVATTGACEGEMVNGGWCSKTYYEVDELLTANLHSNMFGGTTDANSQKWTKVCGQCHVMLSDHGNSEVEFVRKFNLGMSADYVKNGQYVNMTSDKEAAGYDVHMSEGMIGCGACHLVQEDYHGTTDYKFGKDLEAKHNFLKGTDTAHMVRNDLDNNIRPKNCEQCHIEGISGPTGAVNPTAAHEEKFGEHAGIHMEKIACQTCHIPYKKTWRFRAFDDTLGYFGNFDNRMGYDVLGTDGAGTGATFDMMSYPAEYAISPVYGASPGYGIPHFNMVAQAINANGSGLVPMDYVSEMVDYFHIRKSANPGTIVAGMPTNPQFDFWRYFYQFSINMRIGMGLPLSYDADWDNLTYPPLYWANGTNGYPQIVIGNPITIMTWVDVTAGDADHDGTNEMANISYGGAKVLYLREMMAAISEYYQPTTINQIGPMDMAMIPANDDGTYITGLAGSPTVNMVGRVVLKDSGYTIYDHTGDMYPDIWWDEDVRAVQAALKTVLDTESGGADADPRIFMAAHYFSDTHGVKPAEKALGANSCYDCHGDLATDPGAHRITDRVLNFMPWAPPWFNDANRMGYPGTPADAGDKMFVVDHEVDYINRQDGVNGFSFLGATQEAVLEHTEHLADHFFYQNHGEEVLGGAIYGVNWNRMKDEEKHRSYVPQVTNPRGNLSLKTRDWLPADLRHDVTAFGYVPVAQEIKIRRSNGALQTADARVFVYGLNILDVAGDGLDTDHDGLDTDADGHGADPAEATQAILVKLSQVANNRPEGAAYKPEVVFQAAGSDHDAEWTIISDDDLDALDRRAQVVRFGEGNDNRYALRAGPGRYAVVHISEMVDTTLEVDCNGQLGGTAHQDLCGVCDSDPTNDNTTCNVDCAGVVDGTATIDDCGVCDTDAGNDNTTCVQDCLGNWGGGAYVDNCGVCDTMTGNDNTTCVQDCNGTWGGDAVLDNCGTCDNDPSNDCRQDCAGVWDGSALIDNCGVCDTNGGNDNTTCTQDCTNEWPYLNSAEIEAGNIQLPSPTYTTVNNPAYNHTRTYDDCGVCLPRHDPAWNTSCTRDCAGVWDGIAIVDDCGVCRTSPTDPLVNTTCVQDCAGTWAGSATTDDCGVCDENPANDCTQTVAVSGVDLIWQASTASTTAVDQATAAADCTALAGHGGTFRLPTAAELEGLVREHVTAPHIVDALVPYTSATGIYWASDNDGTYGSGVKYQYPTNNTQEYDPANANLVRCVRTP